MDKSLLSNRAFCKVLTALLSELTHLPHTDLEISEYTDKYREETDAIWISFKNAQGLPISVLIGYELAGELGVPPNVAAMTIANSTAADKTNPIGYAFMVGKNIRSKGTLVLFSPELAVQTITALAHGKATPNVVREKQTVVKPV